MKEIFVGSSQEALQHAELIAAALSEIEGVRAVLWNDVFKTGDITFLAIERLASRVSGAVFLVTPDDESVIRGNSVRTPRANVLFEYGFLTSRLTRHRVALCLYDKAELPSDFAGLTYIPIGPVGERQLSPKAKHTLKSWARELGSIQPGHAATQLLHGYSGVWQCQADFALWRRIAIKEPSFVTLKGEIILSIPLDGQNGRGSLIGMLEAEVDGCYAQFLRNDRIEEAIVDSDGGLRLRCAIQSRQLVESDGSPPQKDGFEPHLRGSREVLMEFPASEKPEGSWRGKYQTEVSDRIVSQAAVKLDR